MKFMIAIAALSVVAVGCGEKVEEMKQAADAMQQMAQASETITENASEAETFMKERREKGDTVAMSNDELKTYLPSSIAGYKPHEEPSVSRQDMPGFSLATAEQQWVSTSGDTNQPARIKVTLADMGGTQGGYAFFMLPMSMNISQEDAHRRSGTVKVDLPHTSAMEEYDKDSKQSKFTVGTRYRYLVTVEATDQQEDQSAKTKEIALSVAEKLKDK